jgi:hypothetical protein
VWRVSPTKGTSKPDFILKVIIEMKSQLTTKDDPLYLLNKPSYRTVVLKLKAPHLNLLCAPCCYTEANSAKLYKWIPYDKSDVTRGESGKRILKLKERSDCCKRYVTPGGYRGFSTLFKAENSARIVFQMDRPGKPTFLCWARPEAKIYLTRQMK